MSKEDKLYINVDTERMYLGTTVSLNMSIAIIRAELGGVKEDDIWEHTNRSRIRLKSKTSEIFTKLAKLTVDDLDELEEWSKKRARKHVILQNRIDVLQERLDAQNDVHEKPKGPKPK